MKLKLLFSGFFLASIFAFGGSIVFAAGLASETLAASKKQVGIVTYYYGYKSNAVGKLNAELKRGKQARMYYDNIRRKWAVEVNSNNGGSKTGVTTVGTNKVITGAGCEAYLQNNATMTYYPASMKSLAQDMYNAHLRQGDCAKLWFDSSRNEWALAIKAVINGRSRNGKIQTATTAINKKPIVTTTTPVLPRGANISYFPDRSTAAAIYNGALKQGDWTKMWYDSNRRMWAVAIKVR